MTVIIRSTENIKRVARAIFLTVALFGLRGAELVYAQGAMDTGPTLTNPLRVNNVEEFLAAVLRVVQMILSPFVVLVIIYAGFQFLTAQGNKSKIETAKRMLLYAVIGAAIILGAGILATSLTDTVRDLQA
jgi:hypothetical protein